MKHNYFPTQVLIKRKKTGEILAVICWLQNWTRSEAPPTCLSGPAGTCVDPGKKATRSGCPSAARGRRAAGRWAPGWAGCRRSGTWTSAGQTGRRAGPATGRCACAAGRRWSSEARGECGSWTGGGGWRRSADGAGLRRRRTRRRCRRGKCSCRRWLRRSGRWLDTPEGPSVSAVGVKQQSHF